MTTYYIDVGQTGGNGLYPTSAYPSLSSVAWAAGDIAWIRRTHDECGAHDKQLFATWSTNPFARVAAAVGWPDAGDPFYEQRPSAGITAGWDSDAPATAVYSIFGYKFPLICTSTNAINTSAVVGRGMILANIALNLLPLNSVFPLRVLGQGTIDNVLLIRSLSSWSGFGTSAWPGEKLGKVIVPSSLGSTTGIFAATPEVDIEHLVVPSASIISHGGALAQTSNPSRIGVLEILSSSVACIAGYGAGSLLNEGTVIERCIGTKPWLDVGTNGIASANGAQVVIEDYYGEGVVLFNGYGKPNYFTATSAQASYTGSFYSRVSRWFTNSGAAAGQSYTHEMAARPIIRKYVSVVSGTSYTFVVPVYVGTTNVLSVADLSFRLHMKAKGAVVAYANAASVNAGSYSNWAGTFISGGSAWLAAFKFTPQETGIVPLDVLPPYATQATSGAAVQGYALFAEPYSV